MAEQTMGKLIAALRKEHNMTQADLAAHLGVTDKAVSKWERDLACPDIALLPRLAEVFGISVDELMQCNKKQAAKTESNLPLILLICKAVALAMGVAGCVLSFLKQIDPYSGISMLSVAVMALAIHAFLKDKQN